MERLKKIWTSLFTWMLTYVTKFYWWYYSKCYYHQLRNKTYWFKPGKTIFKPLSNNKTFKWFFLIESGIGFKVLLIVERLSQCFHEMFYSEFNGQILMVLLSFYFIVSNYIYFCIINLTIRFGSVCYTLP